MNYQNLLFAAVFTASSACVVTDVGNPQTTPTPPSEETPLEIQAFDETSPKALTLASGLEFTHAWVSLDRFRAEGCEVEEETDAGEDEVEPSDLDIEGPVIVDLISGRSYPSAVQLPSDKVFCKLEVEFKPAEIAGVAGVPADFAELSIMVRGTRADGRPFEVRGNFSEGFKLDGEVALQEMDALILGFAANEWLSDAQLDGLDGDPIRIDADTNTEVYEAFRDAFKASSRLFRDEDQDGELDADEALEALAIGDEEG